MASSHYARPEMLVETAWIAQQLGEPGLRIVDARRALDYWLGHIPGAVNIPLPGWYLKDPQDPVHIVTPEQFRRVMENSGIGDDTMIVAYDDDGGHHAARIWWALEYYGHHGAVRLLNGGWDKWQTEGRPFSTGLPRPPHAKFTTRLDSSHLATQEQVRQAVERRSSFGPGSHQTVLLDVRSAEEHAGVEKRQNRYGGHVPGAVHLEWKRSVTNDSLKTWLPAQELRRLFQAAGVTPERETIAY